MAHARRKPRHRDAAPLGGTFRSTDHTVIGASSNAAWVPLSILRTNYKRELGRVRFENATAWFSRCDPDLERVNASNLYDAGVTAHLALTAYLLDFGFDDDWCAENLAYRITEALDWANAAGLDFGSTSMAHVAVVLTPYWKWGPLHRDQRTDLRPSGIHGRLLHGTLDNLLHRIGTRTGYPRS